MIHDITTQEFKAVRQLIDKYPNLESKRAELRQEWNQFYKSTSDPKEASDGT
jgi:hypothetical protein